MVETDNKDQSSPSTNGLESIPPHTLTMPEVVREDATMGCRAEEDTSAHSVSIVVPSNDNAALNADHEVKTYAMVEAVNGVQGQEMFSSSTMPAESILRDKTDSLTTKRKCNNASSKLRHRNVAIQSGQDAVDGSANLKGAPEIDHKQLLEAANSVHLAKRLAFDNPFWSDMEFFFGPVRPENLEFLKNQDLTESDSEEHGNDKVKDSIDSDPLFREVHMSSRPDKVPTLAQRLLEALIDEDDEVEDISSQCTNDTSENGSLNAMEIDPKNCNTALTEVELEVDLQAPKKRMLDGVSCDRNIASLTQSNQHVPSSSLCNVQCSTNDNLSLPVELASPVVCEEDPGSNFPLNLSTSDISSCSTEYQSLPLDDKIEMELQSIGIHLDSMPCPALVEKSIDEDIAELQAELDQRVKKKKRLLREIDKAIRREREGFERSAEQLALDQLVLMSQKKLAACTSKKAANKSAQGKAKAFAKSTLARYKEYETTGKSCFAEPSLKEVILSSPPVEKDKKSAVSKFLKKLSGGCNKLATRKASPQNQAKTAASNAEKAGSSGTKPSSVAMTSRRDSSSRMVKKKKCLSDCCTGKAVDTISSPARGKRNNNVRRKEECQRANPHSRKKRSHLSKTASESASVKRANPHSLPVESSISKHLRRADDLILLNLDAENVMESDCVGLATPMDDLCDVVFF